MLVRANHREMCMSIGRGNEETPVEVTRCWALLTQPGPHCLQCLLLELLGQVDANCPGEVWPMLLRVNPTLRSEDWEWWMTCEVLVFQRELILTGFTFLVKTSAFPSQWMTDPAGVSRNPPRFFNQLVQLHQFCNYPCNKFHRSLIEVLFLSSNMTRPALV